MPNKTVWIYNYTDENDAYGSVFLVFGKQEAALAHAADSIKDMASREMAAFDWSEDSSNVENLQEIMKSISEGRHSDALAEWEDYRTENGHHESVSVIEAGFVE
jgi:hypothetical protein